VSADARLRTFLGRLSHDTCVLNPSVPPSTRLFRSKTHTFTAVQNPQEADYAARVRFCNWFCEAVCNGKVKILLPGLRDEFTRAVK
jgi:hypothetical protein